jgi:hypothetical protein
MEALTQTRFDHLARDFALAPLTLDAGFNYAGVSRSRRVQASPLFRRDPNADCPDWIAQVDDSLTRTQPGPTILSAPDYDLSTYVPGRNGTLFSPQGGLRASFSDLLTMGEAWLLSDAEPLWNSATQPGETLDNHFIQFGLGRYIYPAETSPIPGVRLIGHAGEAYGFYGGLWAAPDHNAVFTFGQLGSTLDGPAMTGGLPNLRSTTRAYFDRIAPYLRA